MVLILKGGKQAQTQWSVSLHAVLTWVSLVSSFNSAILLDGEARSSFPGSKAPLSQS